jgi:hypothetical protein
LYEIQQQQIKTTSTKLLQKFPQEHSSCFLSDISCLIQINPNTLVSSSYSDSPSDSYNVIVIWTKSPKSSSLYEPIQRITQKEAGAYIRSLVLITQKKEEEEEFASCSHLDHLIIIWRRGKGEGEFQIKQKIKTNVKYVVTLLYISLTNELISGSNFSSSPSIGLLQIWSPSSSSSSSSSDFVEKQKIQTSSTIGPLCHINENRNNDSKRIEFASGHSNGQIMIWSKQQQINESKYSSIRTLQTFNNDHWVNDLIFINKNGFDFLISCCKSENKIKIFKGEEQKEEEELEHKGVYSLIPMSNGQFASGGWNKCLNIWSPSS